ncbi:hypothetical protein Tco_0682125 [Tanacetum coccineum]|uniref:Uncharacterized protein n=1 Tax=Tanacetum coccineum TaxID=301880 RepID=A0ABQ4XRU0_9ASTR
MSLFPHLRDTEPAIHTPSTGHLLLGLRITFRAQVPLSLHQRQRLRGLGMTTPSPSPPISLSPPSARECLARIASTQALIDGLTAALPSPPLPPPLYIPPPVDRSRYEIGESSTARPNGGWGIDYGFVSTVDAEERRQGIRDVGYGIRDTWIDPAEDLYALLEDAQDRDRIDGEGGGLCFPRGLGSLDRIESDDPSGASDPS